MQHNGVVAIKHHLYYYRYLWHCLQMDFNPLINHQVTTLTMENNESKHTKGTWKLWGTSIYADQDGTSNLDTAVFIADVPQEVDGKLRTHNAEFIVTACNNYQALKEENESLTTQLAKANSDKDKLGELLKLWAIIKAEDITIMKSQCPEDEQGYYDVLLQCEISYNNIKQTLQDCGITL